ncbi:MAG: T9SS type A sorting domain-containing protein [Ignavibacteria bacterium]|nr:T9SS type A sorting domain-containing protein [Ignavibacteria bacterium]
MRKITIIFSIAFIMLYSSTLLSQYNNKISAGVAPWLPNAGNYATKSILTNPNATGFSYYPVGTSGSQLFKYKVGTPGSTTLLGTTQPYLFGNGDFANPTGVWKYYVMAQNASPYTIFEVDTATGNITSVGAPLNLKSGHTPLDMEWDQTTSSFFIVSSNDSLTETQLYKMDWNTKNLTWIGSSVTTPGAIVAGGFNANGTYFGIDMVSDALWKVNKNTGIWTQVGPLNYPVNYAQDAGFDRADFSRMLWCAAGGTVGLYEVDTSNAMINLIGTFPSSYTQVMAAAYVTGPGPQITATQVLNTQNAAGPYIVNAVVTPGGAGIASTKIYWSRNNPFVTDSISMTNSSGHNWTGGIPGNGSPATYRYYCRTVDSLGRFAVAPFGAPANLYTFLVLGADTIKPVITHTPIGNTIKTLWPDTVTATVTDNYGLDSVWVRWSRNSTASKEFKLLNSTPNNYKASFNSLNSEVYTGDTIYYRIIAQDNSLSHNRDSTALYHFLILSGPYDCIGTGTVELMGGPFATEYYGNRSQILYTASEILNSGGMHGNITKIGFNIAYSSGLGMNNFSIKFQSISDTSITAFVNNNWTNVFSGDYSLPGLGWQYIVLQTPFEWDGISNLLVEICFENTINYVSNRVRASSLQNHHYYASQMEDLSSACTAFQNPIFMNYRPNACFRIEPIVNINEPGIQLASFKLSQNYPNPFNPGTRISYEIPKQGFVSLKIYDILGREVKTLVNEVKTSGAYSIDFNAANLPSGIYLCRMECGGYAETKRMILLK